MTHTMVGTLTNKGWVKARRTANNPKGEVWSAHECRLEFLHWLRRRLQWDEEWRVESEEILQRRLAEEKQRVAATSVIRVGSGEDLQMFGVAVARALGIELKRQPLILDEE